MLGQQWLQARSEQATKEAFVPRSSHFPPFCNVGIYTIKYTALKPQHFQHAKHPLSVLFFFVQIMFLSDEQEMEEPKSHELLSFPLLYCIHSIHRSLTLSNYSRFYRVLKCLVASILISIFNSCKRMLEFLSKLKKSRYCITFPFYILGITSWCHFIYKGHIFGTRILMDLQDKNIGYFYHILLQRPRKRMSI